MKSILFLTFLVMACPAVFAQHSLQEYIATAQQNSPLINDYSNQVKASNYDLQRLKAIFTGAQLDLNGNFLFAPILSRDNNRSALELNSKGANNYYGYELGQTNGGLYQGVITYTQPLFNEGRYKVAAAQVDAGRQANQQLIRMSRHDLEKLVGDQYILCLQDEKQAEFTDSLVALLRGQIAMVKKLAAASILRQSDLTLLNVEYENDQYILAGFRASYYSKLMDLNALCGISDTTTVALPEIRLQLNGMTTATDSNSGYLEKFRLDSLNLVAAQSMFELKYKPTLNFFANTGLDATYVSTALNRFGLGAGLSFTWNLFDGRQRRITREKTTILQQTTAFYRDNFLVQNAMRKRKFLADLSSNLARMDNLRQQTSEYRQLLEDYRKQILQGEVSIVNYVMVLKSMNMLKRDYYVAETNSLLLINGYNYWNW